MYIPTDILNIIYMYKHQIELYDCLRLIKNDTKFFKEANRSMTNRTVSSQRIPLIYWNLESQCPEIRKRFRRYTNPIDIRMWLNPLVTTC